MNTQQLMAKGSDRIKQSTDLEHVCNIAVEIAQQLYQCNHVAIFQLLENQQSSLKAEIRKGRNLRPLKVATPDQDFQPDHFTDSIGNFLVNYLTFPIFVLPKNQQRSHIWGYLVIHQSPDTTPASLELQTMAQELMVQVAIAIQRLDICAHENIFTRKVQDLERYKLGIVKAISHEYRTPLTKILASAATLEQHGHRLPPSTKDRFLQLIQDQARHLSQITDKVLETTEHQESLPQ